MPITIVKVATTEDLLVSKDDSTGHSKEVDRGRRGKIVLNSEQEWTLSAQLG